MNLYGAGVLWGLADMSTVSLSSLSNFTLLQNVEVTDGSQEDKILDTGGATKALCKYDFDRKMTCEFHPYSTAVGGTITVSAWPTVGSTITVTNTTFTPAGGAWIVDSWNWTRSNKAALMARVSLSRYLDNSVPA